MYQILQPSVGTGAVLGPSGTNYINVTTTSTSHKSSSNILSLSPPSPFHCICCSTPFSLVPGAGFGEAPVQEIHLYTQNNEFERRVTILEALEQIFGTGNHKVPIPISTAVSQAHVLALCPKCANVISSLYKDFINLLHCSDDTGYLSKLLPQIQNWHYHHDHEQEQTNLEPEVDTIDEIERDSVADDDSAHQLLSDDYEFETGFVAPAPVAQGSSKSKISKLRSKYLNKSKKKKTVKRSTKVTMTKKHKLEPNTDPEDPTDPRTTTNIVKKRRGRYICQNIKKRNYFYCPLCPHRELYNWKLHLHIMSIHNEIPMDGKCTSSPTCGWTYYSALVRPETHICLLEPITESPTFCDVCGLCFKSEFRLETHYERDHVRDSIRFQCVNCPKQTKNRNKLYSHQEIHSETRKYLCPECGLSFSQKRGLDRHQEIHNREPIPCEICGKFFRNLLSLNSHKLSAHPGEGEESEELRTFQCDECPKRFKANKHLIEHKHHVHSENPNLHKRFKCTSCHKSFWRNSHLVKHYRSHLKMTEGGEGSKPSYPCPVCGTCRSSMKVLSNHLVSKHRPDFRNMETKPALSETTKAKAKSKAKEKALAKEIQKIEKIELKIELKKVDSMTREELELAERDDVKRTPWKCGTCGKYYSARKNLIEHQLIHTGQHLKETCGICTKRFRTITHLRKHLLVHDNENDGECRPKTRKSKESEIEKVKVSKTRPSKRKVPETESTDSEAESGNEKPDIKPDLNQLVIKPVPSPTISPPRRTSGRVTVKKNTDDFFVYH